MKERNLDNTVLSLRFTREEAKRFWEVMDAVKARNPWLSRSDIYREMIGLAPLTGFTKEELEFFRTGNIKPTKVSGKKQTIAVLKEKAK